MEKCGYRSVIAWAARGYFCSVDVNLTMLAEMGLEPLVRPLSPSAASNRLHRRQGSRRGGGSGP
jgi:hypothetical protein